jgi:ProP effector
MNHAARKARAARSKAIIGIIAELCPKAIKLYAARRAPLKRGVHHDLLHLCGPAIAAGSLTPLDLRIALSRYCRSGAYLFHLKEGAERVDLFGNVAGTVTAAEAEHALRLLDAKRRRRLPRLAAKTPITKKQTASKPGKLADGVTKRHPICEPHIAA